MPNYTYGIESRLQLATVDERLVRVMHEALGYGLANWSIIEGHRGEIKQNRAYDTGNSKVKWPNSNHNYTPSLAIDFIPYPFRGWAEVSDFVFVAGIILTAGTVIGIPMRWGGRWAGSGQIMPEGAFNDLGHMELI